jgi:RND family efflux transporter MFP subunit
MLRRHKRILIPAAALAVGLVGCFVFATRHNDVPLFGLTKANAAPDSSAAAAVPDSARTPAVPVEVATVERRAVAAFHRAASSIEAARLVEVPCRAAGSVRAVTVEEGDWVVRDQILAELDNARQKLELRRAELQLAEQRRKLQRAEQMAGESLISQEEFDTQRTAYERTEAERDLAAINLTETYVKAPFAGQLTARHVVAGQQVLGGQAAFVLADFEPLRVRVHLPEAVAAKIAIGEPAVLETDAAAGQLQAWVERINPVVDPGTGTVQVTLRLPAAAAVRAGGFVKVRLTTDRKQDVLAVPKLALVDEGGLRSVFVAAADTVRKVEITTGLYDDTHVEVTSGLEEGWLVVTLGRGGLRTGTSIEILPDSNLTALASR